MVWGTNLIPAVVGDVGPGNKFGEGSRALLRWLQDGKNSATIEDREAAKVILLPEPEGKLLTKWPIDAKVLERRGAALLAKLGGRGAVRACQDIGLRDLGDPRAGLTMPGGSARRSPAPLRGTHSLARGHAQSCDKAGC